MYNNYHLDSRGELSDVGFAVDGLAVATKWHPEASR